MPTDSGRREDPPPRKPEVPPDDTANGSARTPGVDVTRALAVFGMVIVNYKVRLQAGGRGPDWLVWLSDRLDGRAAALFVILAGVGISLRSRAARLDPEPHLAFERRALLKRAAVLFAVGLVNLHMWDWDILHCYGLLLAAAAFLLNVQGRVLWLLALLSMAGAVLLQLTLDYYAEPDFWTLLGAPSNILFNGLYPFFPWFSFLLVGMLVGRLDLNDDAVRRRLLLAALAAATSGELIDTVVDRAFQAGAVGAQAAAWLNSSYMPPRPVYVVAAAGTALAILCMCIQVTRSRPRALWVVALMATGQLAFTLYILHVIAILIPIQHGWLSHAPLAEAIGYAMAFYAVAVPLSLWWRRRFSYGPLELFIRQVTGRVTPGPWGGQLLAAEAHGRVSRRPPGSRPAPGHPSKPLEIDSTIAEVVARETRR